MDAGEEFMIVSRHMDGELAPGVMLWQAKRILVRAARGRGFQTLDLRQMDGTVLEEVRIRNAKGGCIILDADGAGTKLGADLVLAMEALGAGNKVQIERPEGGAE
jgi:hypothetical protein